MGTTIKLRCSEDPAASFFFLNKYIYSENDHLFQMYVWVEQCWSVKAGQRNPNLIFFFFFSEFGTNYTHVFLFFFDIFRKKKFYDNSQWLFWVNFSTKQIVIFLGGEAGKFGINIYMVTHFIVFWCIFKHWCTFVLFCFCFLLAWTVSEILTWYL